MVINTINTFTGVCACTTCGHVSVIPFFFTLEQYRGQGVGRHIFELTLKHLAGPCTVLSSVPNMIGFYEKYGFKQTGELQYSIEISMDNITTSGVEPDKRIEVRTIGGCCVDEFVCYDHSLSKSAIDRRDYVKSIWAPDVSMKFGAAAYKDGKVVGTICLRSGENHPEALKVVMFYADSSDIATSLLLTAIASQESISRYKVLITDKNFTNLRSMFSGLGLDMDALIVGVNPYVTCCLGQFDDSLVSYDKVYARSAHMADIF